MNYKKRIKKSFDYEKIKTAVTKSINNPSAPWTDMWLLWTPGIRFRGNGWSSVDYPLEKTYDVEARTGGVLFLTFGTEKNFFRKKKDFFGQVRFLYIEEEERCRPVIEYLKSRANIHIQGIEDCFSFNTYEELENYLKGLEAVINETCDGYIYFDKDEAMENSSIKKDMFSLVAVENELVELDHKLRMAQETQDRQRVNLTEMIEDLKGKINSLKKRMNELQNPE